MIDIKLGDVVLNAIMKILDKNISNTKKSLVEM